jgi:hypothetical protein
VSVVRVLVGLYPAPFRERWGPQIEAEAEATGRRSWVNLAMGVVDAWLHPAIWPVRSRSQQHRWVGQVGVALGIAGWFVVYLEAELDDRASAAGFRAGLVNGFALLLALGLFLAAPRPRMTWEATVTMLRCSARLLMGPATVGAGVVAAVSCTGLSETSPSWLKLLVLGCWWTSLGWASVQACRILPGLDAQMVAEPTPARLRVGLGCLAAALSAAGTMILGSGVTGSGWDLLSTVGGVALIGLACLLASMVHSLRGGWIGLNC